MVKSKVGTGFLPRSPPLPNPMNENQNQSHQYPSNAKTHCQHNLRFGIVASTMKGRRRWATTTSTETRLPRLPLPFYRATQQLLRILLHVQCQKNTESSPENSKHHENQGWKWWFSFLPSKSFSGFFFGPCFLKGNDPYGKIPPHFPLQAHKVHTVLDAAASPSLNAPASPSLALALGKDLARCRQIEIDGLPVAC